MECADFLQFQETLKKMRDLDDKIVYALNVKIPTPSFRGEINPEKSCQELYEESNYYKREESIKNCINVTTCKIKELRDKRDAATEGDPQVLKLLSKEQTKLRLLKNELLVEEVVKDRSLKLYYERCREYYKPPLQSSNFL